MTEHKKVVIAGATGLIGKKLCKELLRRGYALVVVSRDITEARKIIPEAADYVAWQETDALVRAVDEAYGVINLSGAPIAGKRWTAAYKSLLFASRVKTSQTLVKAIKQSHKKARVLINGSAIGFYGNKTHDSLCDELSRAGTDFLAQVCIAWEEAALQAESVGTRVVCIRSGLVLDRHEGVLPQMIVPFNFFVGGPISSGRQWFPWIHITDEVGIMLTALENDSISGPINAVSPDLVTNKEFSTVLGQVLNRPSWFHIPKFVLELIFGEAASFITTGTKVSSKKIISAGYTFQYDDLEDALRDILR